MDNWWAKDNTEEDSESEEEEIEEECDDDINECNPFMALDTDPS